MSSHSYWLAQIKQSEAVAKHQVSLGFFKLALEAGCKNVQLLRDELKSYCFRHKLVDVGGSSSSKRLKKLFQRYNISSSRLPLDIQVEILKRLPIKSVIRCRSVSKQWNSLIGSSEFIVDYSLNCTRLQKHLLVRCRDPEDDHVPKYVSIVDDYSFPRLKSFLPAPIPVSTPPKVSSSQGLFCFYHFNENRILVGGQNYGSTSNTVVLWNPTIRKSVSIDVPNVLDDPYETVIGFGVCPPTSDPMLVKMTYYERWEKRDTVSCIPWQVEVFTLSSGLWRTPLCSNLPRKSISLYYYEYRTEIAIDGWIYWPASDNENSYELIMSFDMTSETFTEVDLPECFAHNPPYCLSLSKLMESLCVIEHEKEGYNVWIMMENGVLKSFTKLYNIDISPKLDPILGFRNNGVPIIKMKKDAVYTYEPNTEQLSYIGIYGGKWVPPFACNYIETLLLLNH